MLLEARDITKAFGSFRAVDAASVTLEQGDILGLIEKAERPVLYCGGGVISGNASEELRRFVEATQIPVTTTIMGCGAFPETHPLSLRWLGMHGTAARRRSCH